MDLDFRSIPIGSLLELQPSERRQRYLDLYVAAPSALTRKVSNTKTSAFLQGLTKQYGLALETAPALAFAVLRVLLGEWPLANLAAGLSSTMGLPNDKAQQAAAEIERELFAPIMGELQAFWTKQRQPKAGAQAQQAGAMNVIDLKHKSQNTEHEQPPKPSLQIKKGPPLPRPGEFRT